MALIDFLCDFGIRPLAYKQAQRRKGEIAVNAGVKEIRLHDFRHSCASLLINSGAPITVVSKFMGLSDTTETLKTYSHMFSGALNQTMDVVNNLKNNGQKCSFFVPIGSKIGSSVYFLT